MNAEFSDVIGFELVAVSEQAHGERTSLSTGVEEEINEESSESGGSPPTIMTTVFLSPNQQVDHQHEHSPETTPLQLTSQNMSAPGTPVSTDLGPVEMGPHVSGHRVNCASPNYVTITTAPNEGVTNLSYTSLTPIKSSNGSERGDEGMRTNGTYVSYVETTPEHSLFAVNPNSATNDDNVFPVYAVGETGQLYHTTGATGPQYYETGTPVSHSSLAYAQQQEETEVPYLVPSGNNNSNDAPNANLVGQPVSHATRVSPATVQWLLENYETAEGVSLPRSTLYYHYIKHTHEHNLDPVNAASFGKLIRSVFLGLRTRRLGTRGNSKYHYYGIRLKLSSPLNALDEKTIDEIMSSTRFNSHHRHPSTNGSHNPTIQNRFSDHPQNNTRSHNTGVATKRQRLLRPSESSEVLNGFSGDDARDIQRYLGDSSHVISSLPELDLNTVLPDGLSTHDLKVFHSLYRELCTHLLTDMINFQFSDFQRRWRTFFRTEKPPACTQEQQHYESILPKVKLSALCSLRHVQDYVRKTDYQLYQNLAVILLPDVLRPIPSAMTQTIRNFAKVVENCMTAAMCGFPEEMISVKLSVLSAFGQTLRRHTSLNHLAQAARAVLQNEVQIHQMLSDLNRVDFSNVEEQASWVCGCNSDIVPDLEADFKGALAQHQTLEEWATWLESVVDRILRPHENTPRYTTVARYFLLKWSFYSSLVIRDLTLRSAASFGSFHLLRLLYDEYMFYLIENRVARAIDTLPIAVMGKKLLNPFHFDTPSTDDDSESYDTSSSHKEFQFQSYANPDNDRHCSNDSPRSTSSTGNNGVVGSLATAIVHSRQNAPVIPGNVESIFQRTEHENTELMARRSFKQKIKG